MLGGVIIYTKDVPAMVAFYETHFGFVVVPRDGDRITELRHPGGGGHLMLHKAAKTQKMGQVLVKLRMDVPDVAGKRDALIAAGISVGPLGDGLGYDYANLKDPSGNSISLSNRYLHVT